MLTLILSFGLFVVAAAGWYTYRIVKAAAKDAPGSSKIDNVGDLNYNNKLGKFGIDGL